MGKRSHQCRICAWRIKNDGSGVSFCGHPDKPDDERWPLPRNNKCTLWKHDGKIRESSWIAAINKPSQESL
jgi:hypothetical protein